MSNINEKSDREFNDDMAILVVSYDGYSDLWNDFFNLLKKNWPDAPYSVYLANNIKRPNYEGVSVINCGIDAMWSDRARTALDSIDTRYICLLFEDYFIGDQVDNKLLNETLKIINDNGISYYKLDDFVKIKSKNYNNCNYLFEIPSDYEYGLSLQPAIWERSFLFELLKDKSYSAWEFELERVQEAKNGYEGNLNGCIYDNRNILNIVHGVVQGKILPSAIKTLKKKGYYLNLNEREVMSKKEYYIYQLKILGKRLLPKRVSKVVKKVLRKMGMKFVSDKYMDN